MESCKDMAHHRKRLNEDSFMIEKGKEPRSSAVKMKIRAKKQTTKEKNGGISRKIKDLRRDVEALLKQKFVKNVVQDLTSGGKDCFPKYTKQFLNHYYGMNEFFRGERQCHNLQKIIVNLVQHSNSPVSMSGLKYAILSSIFKNFLHSIAHNFFLIPCFTGSQHLQLYSFIFGLLSKFFAKKYSLLDNNFFPSSITPSYPFHMQVQPFYYHA